jgi:hypothetical protein
MRFIYYTLFQYFSQVLFVKNAVFVQKSLYLEKFAYYHLAKLQNILFIIHKMTVFAQKTDFYAVLPKTVMRGKM